VAIARSGQHFCSPSYCVVPCGGARIDPVKQHAENQKAVDGKERTHDVDQLECHSGSFSSRPWST
jgi:hypothetical protein